MFIATSRPSNTLRSVRSEISFQPESGYKHLAPLGRNPTAATCYTSNLNPPITKLAICRSLTR